MAQLKVLFGGVGLGGLCLAQVLSQHDVEVAIFERDQSPWDRPQGYKLHIDSDGVNALSQSLPPQLFNLFDATSMKPLPFTTIIDTKLAIHYRLSGCEQGNGHMHSFHVLASQLNVNHATLRQILLTGLEEMIHFGKKLLSYRRIGRSVFFMERCAL